MINISKPSQITKIYLVTNCYGDPNKVYIGKTKNCRKNRHKCKFGKQIIYDYIDEVNSLDSKDWKPLECFWIEYFRQLGFNIQNKNNGGNGMDFASKETKDKISNNKLGKGIKSIFQYDLEGNFIKEWKSIRSASFKINNSKGSDITGCCKGKLKTAYGYIWRYKEYPLESNYKHTPNGHSKPIIQYSLENKFIKEWNSATHAYKENPNFNIITILKCCKGKLKTSGGYKWKFKNKLI